MKKLFIIICLALVMSTSVSAAEPAFSPKRIISLSPSTTELLFALGLGDRIAGVTTFCDYPAEAKSKPKIGGMSNPSLEAIVTLKPDLVVMTTDGNPKEVAERLRSMKIGVYVFKARRLHELPEGIRELGGAVMMREAADKLAADIEYSLSAAAQGKSRNLKYRKALFIVWPEPLIVAGPGTAIADAVSLLGLENTASLATTEYPRYSIEEVIRQEPEILFIGKGSGMDMRAVSKGILKKIDTVPAVRNSAVCYVGDGLYRLGPRVVSGIKELAECLP